MNSKKSFTLVELMVVIAIIAILGVAAVPVAGYALRRARDTKKQENVDQLAISIQAYYDEYLEYPSGVSANALMGDVKFNEFVESWTLDAKPCNSIDKCYAYSRVDDEAYALCTCLESKTRDSSTANKCENLEDCYCVGDASEAKKRAACLTLFSKE